MLCSSPGVLESLRVEGRGASAEHDLDTTMRVEMFGLHPISVAAYLEPFGIEPEADEISFSLDVEARARGVVSDLGAEGEGQAAVEVDRDESDVKIVDTVEAAVSLKGLFAGVAAGAAGLVSEVTGEETEAKDR